MNRIIKKIIDGKACDCYEVGDTGKTRLQLEGTFSGDISRESLILVPLSLSEDDLSKIHDFWLTEQEFSLGLPPGESCSSAAFWVGSNDSSKDISITDAYDAIIHHVTLLSQIKDPQDERIQLSKNHIYHTSQESKLLFWISAEFGYETQLSLCGQVRMQNKDDEDFLFYYPSIKDALFDWENELRDDLRAYRKEIAFIEKLRSDSDSNRKGELQKQQNDPRTHAAVSKNWEWNMKYRGFEITSCEDTGIERFREDSKRTVICNGYYCRVYPAGDEQLAYQLEDFCLAEGYEIPDCSESSLVSGIMKYIDTMYFPLRKAKDDIIATHKTEFPDSLVCWSNVRQNKTALYHVTLLENVPSICAQGLIPQIGERSIDGKETIPGIYLFPTVEDMEDALSGWLGEWYNDHYGEDCALAILQVNLPLDTQISKSTAEYEVICRTAIPPECITVFDEQGRELVDFLPVDKSPDRRSQKSLPVFLSELYIDRQELEYLNKLLQMTGKEIYDKYGLKRDETITNTLHFEDGYFLDVKVVICEEEETPYIDLVLFNNHGREVACDTGEDMVEGEVSFETDHAVYTGVIHSKAKEQTHTPLLASLDAVIHQAESSKPVVISENNVTAQNDPIR